MSCEEKVVKYDTVEDLVFGESIGEYVKANEYCDLSGDWHRAIFKIGNIGKKCTAQKFVVKIAEFKNGAWTSGSCKDKTDAKQIVYVEKAVRLKNTCGKPIDEDGLEIVRENIIRMTMKEYTDIIQAYKKHPTEKNYKKLLDIEREISSEGFQLYIDNVNPEDIINHYRNKNGIGDIITKREIA